MLACMRGVRACVRACVRMYVCVTVFCICDCDFECVRVHECSRVLFRNIYIYIYIYHHHAVGRDATKTASIT